MPLVSVANFHVGACAQLRFRLWNPTSLQHMTLSGYLFHDRFPVSESTTEVLDFTLLPKHHSDNLLYSTVGSNLMANKESQCLFSLFIPVFCALLISLPSSFFTLSSPKLHAHKLLLHWFGLCLPNFPQRFPSSSFLCLSTFSLRVVISLTWHSQHMIYAYPSLVHTLLDSSLQCCNSFLWGHIILIALPFDSSWFCC